MGDVVDLSSRKPHLAGQVTCTHCGDIWQAVAPVGTIELECPSCLTYKGLWVNAVVLEEFWRCNCGGTLFYLMPTGPMCRECGHISQDWANQ